MKRFLAAAAFAPMALILAGVAILCWYPDDEPGESERLDL